MGSEKGLEGRGRGKKRRLEGLEVKMTSSFSPFSISSKSWKVGKLPSFFLPKASICHLEEHSNSSSFTYNPSSLFVVTIISL